MSVAAEPRNEAQRLMTLLCLRILDTPREERFDRITRLVAAHFNVAIAAINLIDARRQWSKADVGLGVSELPRAISFCAHAILVDDMLLVPEAKADARFCDNPLVTGEPHLRFYAGVPLRSAEGDALGTLCIADDAPRTLSATEIGHLRDFAAWAERELTTGQLSEALLCQQETEDALRLSEARYAAVLASLSEGILVQDADGDIRSCNASAERILGLSADQLMGQQSIDPRWRAVHEDGSPFPGEEYPAMMTLRTGEAQEGVIMGVHKPDGALTWISVNAHPLHYRDDDTPRGVACSFVDITQHKQYEEQLTTYQRQLESHNAILTVLATIDGMTGITNKRTMLERLAVELDAAHQLRLPLSLVLIDVDHFKAYNDSFGHPAGDDVLKQVAQMLYVNARSTDLVARYGGEEFVLVLPNTDSEGARHVAERCRAVIAQATFPHRNVTASFGIATLQGGPMTSSALIAHADTALYAAKRQGRNTVVCAAALPAAAHVI
jgi:diguanylate cyclase (GGDEF)-like protein/PAS domain S-box-containing protein